MEYLATHRWRKIAIRVLCVTILLNLAICLMPERPLARLSDPTSAGRDPAIVVLLDFLHGIHDGNSAAVEENVIGGKDRVQIEWTLFNNVDLFTAAADAEVFADPDDEATANEHRFRVGLVTPFGRIPVNAALQRQADGRWVVTDVMPGDVGPHSTYSSGGSSEQSLLSFKTPVPITVQKSILTRLNSDAFRRQAVADAGLNGVVSPALVGQLWAVGWSDDGTELVCGWSGQGQVLELCTRARMASEALSAALDCRAKAEVASAVLLSATPPLSRSQRYNLLYELVVSGDDEVVLPVLDRMATTTGDLSERDALRQLADYLQTHPASPALVADGAGCELIVRNGYYRGRRTQYTESIVSVVEARLSAGGLRKDSIVGTKFELRDQRGHMFGRIIPSKLRGD